MKDEGTGLKNNERKHVWDDPRNVRRLIQWFFGSCVVMILLDVVVHRHPTFEHGEFPFEGWFGFYAIYGFVACVLLVLAAKQMRKVLMRPEDYYEGRFPKPDPEDLAAGQSEQSATEEPDGGGHA